MKKKELYIVGTIIIILVIINVVNYVKRERLKKDYRLIIEEGIEPISINSAGVDELEYLPGVGPALARRIVDYREKNGPFKKIEELKNVKGIGDKLFQRILPFVKL